MEGKNTNIVIKPHDEFLFTLIQLQLRLLNADHFDISPTKSSFIFTTWIKLLRKLLKNLVAWLPREAIRDNLPKAFIKTGNNKCRVILDCAKVFNERPKSLDCQPATWSDYKQHNTIKLPFLSSCHGGRASARFITKDSGFYDLLEHDDIIMAGRSFQIQEDLLLHFCNLQIPPRARTKIQ